MITFVEWCQYSTLAQWIRSETWPFPALEVFHLLGMVLVFGAIFVLNARIFGMALRAQPVSEIARGLAWTLYLGLAIQVISGPLLFSALAMRFYQSGWFRIKLGLFFIALVYHFAVHRRLTFSPKTKGPALRSSALVSMALWSAVILAGLGITLFSQ